MSPETLSRARKFLAEDPDPETRAELEALLAKAERGVAAAGADLDDRFAGTLSFGTACVFSVRMHATAASPGRKRAMRCVSCIKVPEGTIRKNSSRVDAAAIADASTRSKPPEGRNIAMPSMTTSRFR